MARDDPHFRLRIPEDLKAKIEKAAADNARSMTGEIIARLARSFRQEDEFEDLLDRVEQLERRVSGFDSDLDYMRQEFRDEIAQLKPEDDN